MGTVDSENLGYGSAFVSKVLRKMDIVFFIEDQAVIRKILTYLDLWTIPERPPPKSLLQDLDDYDIAS